MTNTLTNPDNLRSALKVGWVFTVLGASALGFAGYSYLHEREFVAHAAHVRGTVVGNQHSTSAKGNRDQYVAIFTFADATGKTWNVTDRTANVRAHPAVVGETCQVLYDPDDPAGAQLETQNTFMDTIGYGFVYIVTGLPIIFIGVFGLRSNYALLRRQRAADGGGPTPGAPTTPAGP